MKFETRMEEKAYLQKFRRYLTKVGFYMADRVIDKYLDENRGWGSTPPEPDEEDDEDGS